MISAGEKIEREYIFNNAKTRLGQLTVSTMFKRKTATISTPATAGVYRPHNSANAVEMTDSSAGRHNPAFVLEPEIDPSSGGAVPAAVSADSDGSSSSSGVSSIEEGGPANDESGAKSGESAGGSTPPKGSGLSLIHI